MYDIQDLANGEIIKELISSDDVISFYLDINPHAESGVTSEEAIQVLNLIGYHVHQID